MASESSFNEAGGTSTNSVKGPDVGDGSQTPVTVSGVADQNILDFYASYTYQITLFLLTKKDYNNLSSNPDKFVPQYALISTGGGYAQAAGSSVTVTAGGQSGSATDTIRHPDFLEDFFIDNLQIGTVVGLNAKSKAANAVEISFNIIEPYGISLLDRLLSACETSGDKCLNYMDQPYLLQIDFIAAPGDQWLEATNKGVITTKRIAIKLLEMKINPNVGGTTYQVRARPYNHTAFDTTVASMPVPFQIEAGTVGEFFGGPDDIAKIFTNIGANEETVERELNLWIEQQSNRIGGKAPTAAEIEAQRNTIVSQLTYKSNSLTAAYNEYMNDIVKKQKLTNLPPTQIAFNFTDSIISNSPIVSTDTAQLENRQMTSTEAGIRNSDSQFKQKEVFQVNRGDSLIDIINKIMEKSAYIRNQIKTINEQIEKQKQKEEQDSTNGRTDANDESASFRYLNWYKIVPTVALSDFDGSTNAYSKKILFNIMPYKAANKYHPNFPKTKVDVKEVVREYNYVYTGKNTDIIKLDIDFNTTFYTQLTTYRSQVEKGGTNLNSNRNPDLAEYGETTPQNSSTDVPTLRSFTGYNEKAIGQNSALNPENQIVADLSKSIYTSQRGDALNLKLTIIGDPAFIKQDDIYYNPGNSPEAWSKFYTDGQGVYNKPINSNTGQIIYDKQQVYVKVNFKNAVDIDDTKGILNRQVKLRNGRYTNGSFTGIYKVLKVNSQFSKGQFTQVLDIVKIPEELLAETQVDKVKIEDKKVAAADDDINNVKVSTNTGTGGGFINGGYGSVGVTSSGEINAPTADLIAAANGPGIEFTI